MPQPVVLTDIYDVPIGDAGNPLVITSPGLTAEVEAIATAAAPTYSEGTLSPFSQTLGGALRVSVVAGGSGTSSTYGAAFPTTGTAMGFKDSTGALMAAGNLDASGFLKVNVAAGSGGNSAASATGAAVPASASYTGANFGGNLSGWTAVQPSGSIIAGQIDLASVAGATVKTGAGTAAGAIRVELPTDGTGKVTAVQATAANLNATVVGSGTAGAAAGGVLSVQGVASMTALKVDGSGVTQPVSGSVTANAGTNLNTSLLALETGGNLATLAGAVTSSVVQSNTKQINGVTVLMGNGVTGTGSQRVTIASDNTAFSVNAVQSGTWNIGTVTAVTAITNALPAGSALIGKVGIDQTTPGTTNNVTAVGPTASGSSLTVNPVTRGGLAKTANPTAVADGQVVNALHDKVGKTVAVSAIRVLKAVQNTTITASTSETTIVTAVASTFLDLYGLTITNTSATACNVTIKDATAGTTRFVFAVPAGDTRGFRMDCGSATPQATVNNNWTATCSASVSSIIITAETVQNL